MFGDRGYGQGIRERLKYGGTWKQEIHSRYTSVFVTNEHKSSQRCPCCFSKSTHPFRAAKERDQTTVSQDRSTFCCINQQNRDADIDSDEDELELNTEELEEESPQNPALVIKGTFSTGSIVLIKEEMPCRRCALDSPGQLM